VYDAFGRMVTATGIIGEDGPVVTARHRYNGLGFRIMWQYDADTDGTLEDAERYYQMFDERWRVIAVFRNQDAAPKEGYVHHAAGPGSPTLRGGSSSSYIDSVILRDRDANAAWTSESDGTLEERRYYCQNWRADVVAITKSDGYPLEYIRYSSYGEPTVYPVSDINMDGVVNTTDLTEWALLQGSASTNAAYANSDINFDGSEDSLDGDLYYFDSYLPNSGLSGKGKLSSPAVGNRIGYAGYQWDPSIKAYHVRHRVLLPEIGRWSRRDPLGLKMLLPSVYEYCNGRALITSDPLGLLSLEEITKELERIRRLLKLDWISDEEKDRLRALEKELQARWYPQLDSSDPKGPFDYDYAARPGACQEILDAKDEVAYEAIQSINAITGAELESQQSGLPLPLITECRYLTDEERRQAKLKHYVRGRDSRGGSNGYYVDADGKVYIGPRENVTPETRVTRPIIRDNKCVRIKIPRRFR